MINPQLLQYVRAQRASGVSKEDISKALSSGGWSAADAAEAFQAIEGVSVAPPQPKPISPPAPVVQPRPVYAPKIKKRRVWPWFILIFIAFVAGVAWGGYIDTPSIA